MSDNLVIRKKERAGVISLTLNRPKKRNALNIPMLTELCSHIQEISEDPENRVILLGGKGPVFCSGLDLKEAQDEELAHESAKLILETLKLVYTCPLVTIAMVHGAAIAAGAGLMSACDFAIAGKGSYIGYPETQRGLVPALVMTLLPSQLKERHLRELLFLGEAVEAQRALEMGLINRIVPAESVLSESLTMAIFALRGAPYAISQTKHLLQNLRHPPLTEDLDRAFAYHMDARNSQEADEGMQAFLEKRDPNWVN
jgi:methylglutaconyl-CoA hydratase